MGCSGRKESSILKLSLFATAVSEHCRLTVCTQWQPTSQKSSFHTFQQVFVPLGNHGLLTHIHRARRLADNWDHFWWVSSSSGQDHALERIENEWPLARATATAFRSTVVVQCRDRFHYSAGFLVLNPVKNHASPLLSLVSCDRVVVVFRQNWERFHDVWNVQVYALTRPRVSFQIALMCCPLTLSLSTEFVRNRSEFFGACLASFLSVSDHASRTST